MQALSIRFSLRTVVTDLCSCKALQENAGRLHGVGGIPLALLPDGYRSAGNSSISTAGGHSHASASNIVARTPLYRAGGSDLRVQQRGLHSGSQRFGCSSFVVTEREHAGRLGSAAV